MKAPTVIASAATGAIIGTSLGNNVNHQSGTFFGNGSHEVFRERPKRLPQMPAPPVSGALWVPGHWTISDRANEWTEGHWEIPTSAVFAFLSA